MQKTKKRFFCLFLLLALFLSSCGGVEKNTQNGYGMGAYVSVTVYGEMPPGMLSEVSLLENQISHRVADSLISRAAKGERVSLSEELQAALLLCGALSEKTGGRFDITLLPATKLWNFDKGGTLPDEAALQEAMALVGFSENVQIANGELSILRGGLDLGAIGKGLACDALLARMQEAHVCGMASVGGSIGLLSRGEEGAYRIGVRDPFSANQSDLIAELSLESGFISTSGSYEKFFEADGVRYHHILDARTGRPVESALVSVTVVAESGVLSDALSTACFLVGEEEGRALCAAYGAEGLFIYENGTVVATEGLKTRLTMASGREVTFR